MLTTFPQEAIFKRHLDHKSDPSKRRRNSSTCEDGRRKFEENKYKCRTDAPSTSGNEPDHRRFIEADEHHDKRVSTNKGPVCDILSADRFEDLQTRPY